MVSLVKGLGIGTAVGAGIGALSSDDGYGAGALRGGIAGAGIGGLAHGVPRGIEAAYKGSGLTRPREGMLSEYGKAALDAFGDTYKSVNSEQNKGLMKSFIPGVKQAAKTSATDREFSLNMVNSMADNVSSFSSQDIQNLANMGKNMERDFNKLHSTSVHKEMSDFFENNFETLRSASKSKKVGIATAAIVDGGLNSVKSHLIDPTISMFGKMKKGDFKGIQKHEMAATAFNALGAYEMGGAVNDIADGNYGSAAGSLALLGAGKLAYGQGANFLKANSMLKERGMTWGGLSKAAVGGVGLQKFSNGAKAWTPEDEMAVVNRFQNAGKNF